MVKEEVVFAYALSKTYFSLKITVLNSHNDMESMAIKVSGIVILNVDNNVLQFIAKFRHVIICGDFNALHKMWDAGSANQNGYGLLDFIEQNDYSVMNTDQPTHMSLSPAGINYSLIDLTLCSPAISHKCYVEVTGDFFNRQRFFKPTKMLAITV